MAILWSLHFTAVQISLRTVPSLTLLFCRRVQHQKPILSWKADREAWEHSARNSSPGRFPAVISCLGNSSADHLSMNLSPYPPIITTASYDILYLTLLPWHEQSLYSYSSTFVPLWKLDGFLWVWHLTPLLFTLKHPISVKQKVSTSKTSSSESWRFLDTTHSITHLCP